MLLLVSVGIHGPQQLPEPLKPRDSQDGDAVVAAERLQQGEVDLQRHVVLIVRCQHAQDHAIGVSEGRTREDVRGMLGWIFNCVPLKKD